MAEFEDRETSELSEDEIAKILAGEGGDDGGASDDGQGADDQGDDGNGADDGGADKGSQGEPDELAKLRADYEKLQKQLSDKEAFIQRQGNEIGDLRRRIPKAPDAEQPDPLAKFVDDPEKAVNEILARREATRTAVETKVEEAIRSKYDDFDELIPDIAAIAKEDGFTDEDVKSFTRNPFSSDPVLVLQYAARAKSAKKIRDLEAKVGELSKKPDEVAKKIEEAAKEKKGITGESGKSGLHAAKITEDQIYGMDDKALDDVIAQGKK